MAIWIPPVYDRKNGLARTTYQDMNRITGNITFLYEYARERGYTIDSRYPIVKTYVHNDVVTYLEWTNLMDSLSILCNAIKFEMTDIVTYTMDWYNFNVVEHLIWNILAFLRGGSQAESHWVGQNYFADSEIYAGGIYE